MARKKTAVYCSISCNIWHIQSFLWLCKIVKIGASISGHLWAVLDTRSIEELIPQEVNMYLYFCSWNKHRQREVNVKKLNYKTQNEDLWHANRYLLCFHTQLPFITKMWHVIDYFLYLVLVNKIGLSNFWLFPFSFFSKRTKESPRFFLDIAHRI